MDDLRCPRCDRAIDGDLYGPCPACIDELRVTQRQDARAVEAEVYEPKMNVTPNAVATKDD
jgi:hypothetical protein